MFIGKISVTVNSATGLKIPEELLEQWPDEQELNPYIVVELDGEEMDRTSTKQGTFNPVWKEALYSDDVITAENLRFVVMHKDTAESDEDIFLAEHSISIPCLLGSDRSSLDGSQDVKKTFMLDHNLDPEGRLEFRIKFERRVNLQNLQRRKAFRNKIYFHNGHTFKVHRFIQPAHCAHCSIILWGLVNEGYRCSACEMSVHKLHYKFIPTTCPGMKTPQAEEKQKFRFHFEIPHQLEPHTYMTPTTCNHCGTILLGLFKQGLKCKSCKKNYHFKHYRRGDIPNDCGVDIKKMYNILQKKCIDPFAVNQLEEEEEAENDDFTMIRNIIERSDIFATVKNKPKLSDLEFLNVLGRGAFGKVIKVRHKETNEIYALKAIDKDNLLENDETEMIMIERSILALGTKNNFLTRLHSAFQTKQHLFLVMEFISGGDLFYHIIQKKWFPEGHARFYAAEIIIALIFLHSQGIIHRDLKLDNVLLDAEGHVKVADFGMCKVGIKDGKRTNTLCGTPDYVAPEVIRKEFYGISCDWWSFGVVLFEMLAGRPPFTGINDDTTFKHILNKDPDYPYGMGKEARQLLEKLLVKDPDERLASKEGQEEEIKKEKFFEQIDWGKLQEREIQPPFLPSTKLNVDLEFKQAQPKLSDVEESYVATGNYDEAFKGFDFYNKNYSQR